MFKTTQSAKKAIVALMVLFLIGSIALLAQASYSELLLCVALEIIFLWAFINPRILQVKYEIPLFLDYEKMTARPLLIAGLVFTATAMVNIFR